MQQEAQQLPNLISDPFHADFLPQLLVVVLRAHAARALHDLEAVFQHRAHNGRLAAHRHGFVVVDESLDHLRADARRLSLELAVHLERQIRALEDLRRAEALVPVRIAHLVATLNLVAARYSVLRERNDLAVHAIRLFRLDKFRSDVLFHGSVSFLFRPQA